MERGVLKEFVVAAGVAAISTTLFLTSNVQAQETECQHDPYPYDRPSVIVPCDSPACNVGPCTTVQDEDTGTSLPQNEESQVERERIEARETQHQGLPERVQDRVINLTANVVARLEGATERFGQIIARIESRITKLSDRGVNTDAAEGALERAKSKLLAAEEGLKNLNSIREAISGDSPREAFSIIRSELRDIHTLLKETYAELRAVVALLKEAVRASDVPQGASSAVTDQDAEPDTNPVDDAE